MKKSSNYINKIVNILIWLMIIVIIYSVFKYIKNNDYMYIYSSMFALFILGMLVLFIVFKYDEVDNNYIFLSKEEYDDLNNKRIINEKIIKEKNKRIKELKYLINKKD